MYNVWLGWYGNNHKPQDWWFNTCWLSSGHKMLKPHSSTIIYMQLSNNNFPLGINKVVKKNNFKIIIKLGSQDKSDYYQELSVYHRADTYTYSYIDTYTCSSENGQ